MNQNSTHNAANYVGIQSKQPPDSQRFPAAHAGWFLKRERLSRGLALNKVAAHLKIRERFLWAIEEGVDAEFPQASNFFPIVSAYARYLEFDPQPLIEHYHAIMPAMLEAQKRGPGNIIALWPAMRARARPFAMATIVFLAVITGVSLWVRRGPASISSGFTIISAPGDLKALKKRDFAKHGDNSFATSSIPAPGKNMVGEGSVQIRKSSLTEALTDYPKVIIPRNHDAIAAQLEAAAADTN